MEDYTTERTAIRLIQKYGKKALPKAVEVARYYLEEGDDEAAKRWVHIGYAVRHHMKIDSIQDVITSASEKNEVEKVPESIA